jgi:dihydrofolate synthase/folylpolyglutamate synthase
VLADKDHRGMLAALAPRAHRLHLVPPDSPRARPTAGYRELAASFGAPVDEHATCAEALHCARRAAGRDGLACVAGSLYLVGEARRLLVEAGG